MGSNPTPTRVHRRRDVAGGVTRTRTVAGTREGGDATEQAVMKPPAINCTNRIWARLRHLCAKQDGPLKGQKLWIRSETGGLILPGAAELDL